MSEPKAITSEAELREAFQEGDIVTFSASPGRWKAHYDEHGNLSFVPHGGFVYVRTTGKSRRAAERARH